MRRSSILASLLLCAACSRGTEGLEGGGGRDAEAALDVSEISDGGEIDAGLTIEDAAITDAGSLLAVGEACTALAQCASSENPLSSMIDDPGGCHQNWPGGYCVDYCALPPDALDGPALVRADCPAGAVCLPRYPFEDPNLRTDVGVCLKECSSDADCRTSDPFPGDGYFCRQRFDFDPNSVPFRNGVCVPPHCRSRGCPDHYDCAC